MKLPYPRPIPLLLAGGLAALPLLPAAQTTEEELAPVLRELNIMSNIFSAALETEAGGSLTAQASAPEAFYLAGQGMVFRFDFNRGPFGPGMQSYWQEFGRDMARMAGEVAQEVMLAFPEADFDLNLDPPPPPAVPADIDQARREELERQREIMQEMQEAMQATRQESQELQRQLRGLQREMRGRRDGDLEALATRMADTQAELESSMARLDDQRGAYDEYRENFERQSRERRDRQRQVLADRAVATLCDYGGTLRSLGEDAFISLIFSDHDDDRDLVRVFRQADVAACDSPQALLENAVSYHLP